jgi:hypothetical protein
MMCFRPFWPFSRQNEISFFCLQTVNKVSHMIGITRNTYLKWNEVLARNEISTCPQRDTKQECEVSINALWGREELQKKVIERF